MVVVEHINVGGNQALFWKNVDEFQEMFVVAKKCKRKYSKIS
jgi:hypothetical protein